MCFVNFKLNVILWVLKKQTLVLSSQKVVNFSGMDILESIAQCVSVFLLKEITVLFIRSVCTCKLYTRRKAVWFVCMWKICPFTCLTQIYEALVKAHILLIRTRLNRNDFSTYNLKNKHVYVQIQTHTLHWAKGSWRDDCGFSPSWVWKSRSSYKFSLTYVLLLLI